MPAPRSRSRRPPFAALLLLLFCSPLNGEAREGLATAEAAAGEAALLADIVVHTPEAVLAVLERLDELASSAEGFPAHEPVVMVLHGAEASTFTRANYARYRDAVDRAARLEAFGLLDVRVCERWMRAEGVEQNDLPSFVQTVPDGMAEERRLERAGHVRF